MKFRKTMRNFHLFDANYDGIYFEENNGYIANHKGHLLFRDLTNANKRGKQCGAVTLSLNPALGSDIIPVIIPWLISHEYALRDFFKDLLAGDLCNIGDEFKISYSEEKGIKVYSPFLDVKKFTKPNKWRVQHVIKALYSNQIIGGTSDLVLTDDWKRDYDNNFSKGELDLKEFCRKLVESDSTAWRIEEREEIEEGIFKLALNHFTFDYKTLFFDNKVK